MGRHCSRGLVTLGLVAAMSMGCGSGGALSDPGGDLAADLSVLSDAREDPTIGDSGLLPDPGPGAEVAPPEDPGSGADGWARDTGGETPEDPCDEDPGAPWCPCTENSQCWTGFCIAAPEGRVCGQFCQENCPEGWFCGQVASNPDPIFLCLPRQPTLCRPCATDRDCDFPGFDPGRIRCLFYGDVEGSFCGGPCIGPRDCPLGYQCQDGQCRREDGVCECSPMAREAGFSTPCRRPGDEGACPGERRCTLDGLGECSAPPPVPEVCNGLDDDCDGQTDEGLGEEECGLGVCRHRVPRCLDGRPQTCDPMEGAREEVCDGLDDDCDGWADQGFPDLDRDGLADCVDPDIDGDGISDDGGGSGVRGDQPCGSGQTTDCDDNCPFVANPGQENQDQDDLGDACDPDQDGDGFPGVLTGGTDCDDRDPLRNPGRGEVCNGVDDNCDGRADEDFPDLDRDGIADCKDPDRDGDGIPEDGDGSAVAGDRPCQGGEVQGCDDNCPDRVNPDQADQDGDGTGDVCDGDRDGDGRPDESDLCPTVPDPAQADFDGDGLGDACDPDDDNDGSPDHQDCAPQSPSQHPGAPEVCNGMDDNCDGRTDEGFPDSDGDGLANCVDPDDDNDGVLDDGSLSGSVGDLPCRGGNVVLCDDNCPVTFNPDQADQDGDGIGDACETDTDGDGWPDMVDNCPVMQNPDQADFDGDDLGDACDPDDDNDFSLDGDDCASRNRMVYPGAPEVCNGMDDNCDGRIDEGWPDLDQDGVADCMDPDLDGDGIGNGVDNCPAFPNPSQEDFDGDGIGDVCDSDLDGDGVCDEGGPLEGLCIRGPSGRDNCPRFPSADQADADGDEQGDPCDPDDDNDFILDAVDNCPKHPNLDQADFDGDGLGDPCDPDLDGDGVPNGQDTCPRYDDRLDSDGDNIPEACEIHFAGHVWPTNGSQGARGQDFVVFVQLWKPGVTTLPGPAEDLLVEVRYRMVGDASWQQGYATYNKDFWFVDDGGINGYNEEHRFTIPGSFTSRGGTLEVDFLPWDLTGGPGYEHLYNNGPIYDQGWMVGRPKSPAPFRYPIP